MGPRVGECLGGIKRFGGHCTTYSASCAVALAEVVRDADTRRLAPRPTTRLLRNHCVRLQGICAKARNGGRVNRGRYRLSVFQPSSWKCMVGQGKANCRRTVQSPSMVAVEGYDMWFGIWGLE